MLIVKIKLFATLQKDRFNIAEKELKAGTTISDVMQYLNFSGKDVSIIFVNGRHSDPNYTIQNHDTIAFFPPIGGG